MTPMELFLQYFEAFELTYLDDDWTRLERFFAPEAVYRIRDSGSYDVDIEGRAQVFAAIKRFLDGFDRQCTREIRPVGMPVAEGNKVLVRGVAAYRRGESPELLLDLEEELEYRDGLIVAITDRYVSPVDEDMKQWLARWGKDLNPSYAA